MRKYQYIWLPALLAVYFIFMTFTFGTDLLRSGQEMRFWGTVAAELIVLCALAYFLKRKGHLRARRERDLRDNEGREGKA